MTHSPQKTQSTELRRTKCNDAVTVSATEPRAGSGGNASQSPI